MCGQVDKEGGVGMDDAAGFFANVFGGERFKDYVSQPFLLVCLLGSAMEEVPFFCAVCTPAVLA